MFVAVEQLDEGVWFTRPLTPRILDAACKNVRHYCRLHSVLLEKRVAHMGLYNGINFYVNSLKDLTDEEYKDYDKLGVNFCRYFTLFYTF